MNETGAPFRPGVAVALVLAAATLLLAMLWMIGAGTGGDTARGHGHAGALGLDGYAGLARLLEADGYTIHQARGDAGLNRPGLLILTPPADADPKRIDRMVAAHRAKGPVLVILPKWSAAQPAARTPGARRGWVTIDGSQLANWPGFYDDVFLTQTPTSKRNPGWEAAGGLRGVLPGAQVASGKSKRMVPLVLASDGGQMLAGYEDEGDYPALAALALGAVEEPRDADQRPLAYPLIQVFEPDLLDNWGLARPENAALAERLVAAAGGGREVTFDLSFNGFGRSRNLLTLAFTPPYLAATLCLLMAALMAGWRAFRRFGPALMPGREIAFGKAALVGHTAALIVRSRRIGLMGQAYATLARERTARALGLPRHTGPDATEAAIDRALAIRTSDDDAARPSFSETARRLRAARDRADLLESAQALHRLQRILTE
jgi:hypothetical protein